MERSLSLCLSSGRWITHLDSQAADLLLALSYTFLANVLHWPAGTVPVTCVNASEESYPLDALPSNQRDSIAKVCPILSLSLSLALVPHSLPLAQLVQKSVVGSTGLPVGVQVLTPMWQDEKCIFVMSEIERGVNFHQSPPLKSL
jgi:Asp-tRNA(Asn)/Glu-tRNA(Gln) amidotransferase A subunit family amidase